VNSKSSSRCSGPSGGRDDSTKIAEKHGVTPSAVSKLRSTFEEGGIEALESTNQEEDQGPNSQLDNQDREQLVELREGEHKLTAGKPISGQLLASLHWSNMSLEFISAWKLFPTLADWSASSIERDRMVVPDPVLTLSYCARFHSSAAVV
jgi:hypothetical protein